MHKSDPTGTRITVERISVTTIRCRIKPQRTVCPVCQSEFDDLRSVKHSGLSGKAISLRSESVEELKSSDDP